MLLVRVWSLHHGTRTARVTVTVTAMEEAEEPGSHCGTTQGEAVMTKERVGLKPEAGMTTKDGRRSGMMQSRAIKASSDFTWQP